MKKLVYPEQDEKFDRFLLESYVDYNKMVKWCPQTQENTGRPSEELKWVIREFKEELLCVFLCYLWPWFTFWC